MIWNFIDPWGRLHEIESDTRKGAEQWAQDWYGKYIDRNYELANGAKCSDTGYLIDLDDDDIEVERIEVKLFYVSYHGDKREHGTW